MRLTQLLVWPATALLLSATSAPSLRAGQAPSSPPRTLPPPVAGSPNVEFPRLPGGQQFSLMPDNQQLQGIPPPKLQLPLKPIVVHRVETTAFGQPRVVCGMVMISGTADHDRKILKPVSPDAPKGVIDTVEGKCESAAVAGEPSPNSPQTAPRSPAR